MNIPAIEANKQIIREVSGSQAQGFGDVCSRYFPDAISREDFLRTFVENVRMIEDTTLYSYIDDTNYISIAHPILKDYIGKSHLEDIDSRGQNISRLIDDTLKISCEGFVEFYFVNPNSLLIK